MFRSLHMKLVLILVLLVVSVMAVVGTFLINSVTSYHIEDFQVQMARVFTPEFIDTLDKNAVGEDGAVRLRDVLSAHTGALGIDANRDFYVLDGETGAYLTGSDDKKGRALEKTPNIMAALSGRVGDRAAAADAYLDLAVPIKGEHAYIAYIKDDKTELSDQTWMLFAITMQAMLFGLVAALLLSFLLSKTITNPIENLTRGAIQIAGGDFSRTLEVHSSDEIGVLTKTFNDMAEVLKSTLEEIEGEKNKLNTLFLHMADGVCAFAQGGKLILMNPVAERMLGIRFDVELKFSDVFGKVDLKEIEDAGERGYVESAYSKNGRDFQIFFAPFGLSENEVGIMAVLHDITEQNKLEQARREFVANVSHELRTPLTNITSYTETLRDNADDLPPEMRDKFLGVIAGEADRMARIVKDLLTLSRLDNGKFDLKFVPFSIKKLLETVYNAMLMSALAQGHKMQLDLAPDLPEMVGDCDRLEQVVVNILSNAVKYTPSGGVIRLQAHMHDTTHIHIVVADNGIGIPKEDLPRLFERFYRVDKARSREGGGTGLGLAIAREIVDFHKGSIWVESEVGSGTRVTIELPTNLPLPV